METKDLIIRKQLGDFSPNRYLSNVAIMHFEGAELASKRIFPICPVDLPSGHFYEFSAADLARDGVQRKPDFGKVAPMVLGHSEQSYSCHVDQILIGVDKIMATAYQRAAGEAGDLERIRTKTVTEQINLHIELEFAKKFFKADVWNNTWTGAASANEAQKKFVKWTSASSDPVSFIDARATDIRRAGRRKPNKLALGVDAFVALKNHEAIKDRVKYSGSTSSPAVVNEQCLAQIFGLEEVVVLDATYNAANVGAVDLKFVNDSKSALLLYAPNQPSIDLPSAGYCFTWLLDGGDYITIDQIEGDRATHTDFLEGLIAFDMRKTSDALACFMTECV